MNAQEFHQTMALGYFKEIYPVIAQNILDKCLVKRGLCVDIGGGSGVLGAEIAKRSDFNVVSIDADPACLEIAREYLLNINMSHRVTPVFGKAENIPIQDNRAELVVSRGSVFFWNDKVRAINEIYRILRPGGYGYIGGGMGSVQLKRHIDDALNNDANWKAMTHKRFRKNLPIHLNQMMGRTNVPYWEMISSDEGTWILFRKEK